jgi:two-component system nitrate/nitrite response regulator NarL
MSPPGVLLADENVLFRSALRVALENTGEFEIVAETADVEATLAATKRLNPPLALIADDLPGEGGGIGVCAQCVDGNGFQTATIVVAASPKQTRLLRALEAGALGYVTRDVSLVELIHDMQAALRGEACIPRRMLGGLLRELIDRRRETNAFLERYSRLTRREKEALSLLARGHDHVMIATILFISPQTARTHIQNVLAKLGVHSRLEAATLALEHGVVNARGDTGHE